MFLNPHTLFFLMVTSTVSLVSSYMTRNALPLSSKVIFQSPMMENVYKEFLLSSKPLNLKKYATAKPKNALKDSKIYYIPIAPIPYRFIPGVGYDYQPVKINPIIKEAKQPAPSPSPAPQPQAQPTNVIINANLPKVPQPMDTRVTRLNGHYYFNGRPFRLQAYRASPKLNVDRYNLKSNLFFNKNIIY